MNVVHADLEQDYEMDEIEKTAYEKAKLNPEWKGADRHFRLELWREEITFLNNVSGKIP